MRRRGHSFYGYNIVLKKYTYAAAFFSGLFLIVILGTGTKITFPKISTTFYKLCFQSTIASFLPDSDQSVLSINAYSIITMLNPVIKANETLSKKYATRYSLIKEKNNTSSVPESTTAENSLELSMAAGGLSFNNATDYAVNAQELLSAPLKFSPLSDTPRVLIIHTHTSEAYSDSPGGRSEDPEHNIIKVGAKIAKTLNENGVKTIHDTTRNDYPSYNGSYKKALSSITHNLEIYPTVEIVLDIHRDYTERSGTQLKPTALFDSKKAAQIMFVVGTDHMGLEHPDWRHNLSFAVKTQNELNNARPNLCRPINIRTERFNQHATKGSLIIEVGSAANTLDEAVLSGQYIGEAIAKILKNL